MLPSDFFAKLPLIGMVHLGPLPGRARYSGPLDAVIERAVADSRAIAEGGMDALMVENFFDSPFEKSSVPPATVAAMTFAVLAIREAVGIPMGVNVLRNDVESAISIAHICGGSFVRCNVYVGAAVTDQGILEGAALRAVRMRQSLGSDVQIWADIGVKHASILGDTPLQNQAVDAVARGLADALIVTGSATGRETPADSIREVKSAVPETPTLVGSGLTVENAARVMAVSDGAIVGTSTKVDGRIDAPVDIRRVRLLVDAIRRLRRL